MTALMERPTRTRRPAPRENQTLAVALAWIEAHCIVPDGFRKGQPFRPYDFQFLYLANFYKVRGDVEFDASNPILGSAFVNRRGLLVGPQKVGKNPLIATQVCLEGVGPALFAGWAQAGDRYACADWGCRCGWVYEYEAGEPMGMPWPTPLIQITAFSEESTENTYNALRPMIEEGPLHDLIPHTGEEFIRLPGGGRIDTVTSSAPSRLGQRVTFVPQDEVGIWTATNKMVKLADTQYRGLAGMGGRASLTCNAWDPSEHSVAQQQYESDATDIYRQFVRPPKNLSYGDRKDRHKIHRLVYPADTWRTNGGHVDLDGIEAEAADLVERDAPQAARFYGNVLVAGAGTAVEPEQWDRLAVPREIASRTRIGAGFDGSISNDATFLRGCTADGYRFIVASWIRPQGEAMVRWRDQNPGKEWKVDRLEVDAAVAKMFADYDVGRMLVDPWWWQTELATWASLYGEDIVLEFDTRQTSRIAPAVDRWRTAIREGTAFHDGDPATSEHVKAAHLRKIRAGDADGDGRTLYTIEKGEDRRKIDGAMADLLAFEAGMTMPAAEVQAEPTVLLGRAR